MGCNCKIKKRMAQMARDFQGNPVYLDYNGTTPTDPRLLRTMDTILRNQWGNASSLHIMGGEAALWEEKTRNRASTFFDKPPESFQFCSTGCEGIHTLLAGLRAKGHSLITSVAEHSVLTQSAQKLFPQHHRLIEINSQGKMNREALDKALSELEKPLLFYSPVNHETGAVQPVKEIYERAQENDALVFLDAVQATPRLECSLWAPYCDGFVISGHKFHVPKGISLVQFNKEIDIPSTRFGGSDETSLFPGTSNTPGIALLGEGLELLSQERATEREFLTNLTGEAEAILLDCSTEVIRESPMDSVPGILCLSLPELGDMENFFLHLAERRICISRFSACTGNVTEKSSILDGMGVPIDRSTHSIRLSFGRFTTRNDFYALKEAINTYG